MFSYLDVKAGTNYPMNLMKPALRERQSPEIHGDAETKAITTSAWVILEKINDVSLFANLSWA